MARAKYQGSTLTADIKARIVDALKNGSFFTQACRAAGISPLTGEDWLKKAKTDDPGGLYAVFAEECENASAIYEVRALALLQKAAEGTATTPGDWRAALEVLKRRAPERWGDSQRIEMAMQKVAKDEIVREVLKAVQDAIYELAPNSFVDGNSARRLYENILERLGGTGSSGGALPAPS
ncbi:MAG: hypothetical protein PVSMB1_04190 [Gemmatimonadaceae bacterium]